MLIRRSAEIKRSGFLHSRNCGKTDGIGSNQWRIGISRQTKVFVYSEKPDFSEKSGFSENFMPENLWHLTYDAPKSG